MADVRRKEQKTCGVCGDHALGSNFNAVTCESCKAFFRRNALKKKEFKCPFDNNCKVDVVTRRFCQKCRLKKCFEIGMKKEWIMTEDEKKAKRKKIERNRQKKSSMIVKQEERSSSPEFKADSPTSMLLSPTSTASPLTPQTPGSMGMVAESNSNRLFVQPLTPSDHEYSPSSKVLVVGSPGDTYSDSTWEGSDIKVDNCGSSKESPAKWQFSDQSQSKEAGKMSNENLDLVNCKQESSPRKTDGESAKLPDSVFTKAVTVEFTELPIRSLHQSKNLTALEKHKLEELVIANAVLKMPLACGIADPSLLDVINMTDHAIRRLIKMSKKITAFKNLCQNDQIALLKGGCTELMILRSVMSYDPEKDCWRGPHGPKRMSIKVDILKEAKGNVYEEHKRFINSFQPHWRTDENIMLILSGIALFTPERPNIIHRDVIKLEQDTYYYLLRRYLESIYSSCEARSSYLKLIHRIQELHILNENHVRVYLDVNPKDVEPLLIEIFDLSH